MLETRLLGKFEIRKDGELIEISSRKAQSLYAYLVLNPGLRHRREKIAGVMWPDIPEDDGRGKLRYTLWQLRQPLGEQFIYADKISVAFNQESDCWLDVAVLETQHPESLSTDDLRQTVSVYQGELLPGFYEDWITFERDRLQARFENNVEQLINRLIAEKRWREILDWGEQWISFGNTPEPAYRALMISHSHLGNKSSAVNAYQRCQQALHHQLDVEPSEETQKIFESITRGDKPGGLIVSGTRTELQTSHGKHRIPAFLELNTEQPGHQRNIFVAREQGLAHLDRAFELTLSGQGQVILARGDAGRGKTALLMEFSQRALDRDETLVVAFGRCEATIGIGDPHLPFRDVLAMFTGDVEYLWASGVISQEGAHRLWNLLPESCIALLDHGPDLIDSFVSGESLLTRAKDFASHQDNWLERLEQFVSLRSSRPAPLNIQHSDLQKGLFEQYTRVLQDLSQNHPLLIILDDLQWADIGSISLLFHLSRRIQGHRILVVGDYRPDEILQFGSEEQHPLAKVITELKRNFGEFEIDLDHYDRVEGRQFIDAYLDTEPNNLLEDFRSALYNLTGGHPLFTIELLRQMQEQGDLQKDDRGKWCQGPTLNWDTLPARVEAVIAGRINRLPAYLSEILNIASIEGQEFTAEVIARVQGSDESTIIHRLSAELEKRHHILEARSIQHITHQRLSRYLFQHHLFQKYMYNALDEVERSHLHEKVGDALEMLYHEEKDQIALQLAKHFEEAGMAEKALVYLIQAGEKAKKQSANAEAINHLTKGLLLLKQLPEDQDRNRSELALQIALSAPLVATKGYTAPEAEQAFERARELCEQIDESPQLATVLWGLWSFYLVRANFTTARKLSEQILTLAQTDQDSNSSLLAHWTLGITLFHLGFFTPAIEHLNQALDLYDAERHNDLTYLFGQNPAVTCLTYSAFTLWLLGYPDQALDKSRQAVSLAEKINHPYSLAFAHGMAAVFYALRREVEDAVLHSNEAIRLSKREGFPYLLAVGITMRAWSKAELGKSSMTVRHILRGINTMDIIGAELGRPIFLYFLAEAYSKDQHIDEGLAALDEAIQVSERNEEHLNLSDLFRLKGELLAYQDKDESEITACFQKAIEIAHGQNAKLMELRGLISWNRFSRNHKQQSMLRQQLATTHEWFTEGFDSIDINDAQALLEIT